jgi:hypothetical protein
MSDTILPVVAALVQAYDAENSAIHQRRGYVERTIVMKPFAYKGAPVMVVGFLLNDVMHRIVLHALGVRRHTADTIAAAYEIKSSLSGVISTNSGVAPKGQF